MYDTITLHLYDGTVIEAVRERQNRIWREKSGLKRNIGFASSLLKNLKELVRQKYSLSGNPQVNVSQNGFCDYPADEMYVLLLQRSSLTGYRVENVLGQIRKVDYQ